MANIKIRAGKPERLEPHDLAGAELDPEPYYFFFRSRSGSQSTLKNWNGARAGVGSGIISAASGSSSF